MKTPLSATKIKIEYYLHLLFKRHIKKSLYARYSGALLLASVSCLTINPIFEIILELVSPECPPTNQILPPYLNILAFAILLLLSIISLIFAKTEEKKIKPEAINSEKKIVGHWKLGNSNVHCYNGNISEIREADIIITSEDTGLELGSITGTSISGRVRKLAATVYNTGEIKKDNLGDFIANWKKEHGKMSNFELGVCVPCPAFEASKNNIKKILAAVAIKKNQDKTTTIDDAALTKILKFALEEARQNNYQSIFIPVFGLGSGNLPAEETTTSTINAIITAHNSLPIEINIYIGTYRHSDLIELIVNLQKKLTLQP